MAIVAIARRKVATAKCKWSNFIENALKNLDGVESVAVDLSKKSVAIKGKIDEAVLKSAIEKAGFEFAGEMK